jgi:transposase
MNQLYGPFQWTLMQDGAPAHTKASSLEYLELDCDVLRGWPSGSPDLNPIENLWAIMKRRVSELAPSTAEELIGVVITVWNEISAEEMFKLLESMTTRLNATIAAQGGHHDY